MDVFWMICIIIILTTCGICGTVFCETIASKIVGFVSMFLALPALFGVITFGIWLNGNRVSGWIIFMAVLLGALLLAALFVAVDVLQQRLDTKAKKA